MVSRLNYFGFPTSIEDEWALFECTLLQHDGHHVRPWFKYQEVRHAFHMGALMMLQKCIGSDEADLKDFAAELDRYLDEHAETCEACQQAREDGMRPLIEALFSEEQQNG
jgi:hypothetical protein